MRASRGSPKGRERPAEVRGEAASILPVAFGIAGIGLLLRLLRLERDELWFDEAFAALVSREGVAELLRQIAGDTSPPLYYLLLRSWGLALGTEPIALRSLSVLSGAASVVLTALLGDRLWNRAAGLAAAAFLAVSPLHVHYSREVRPYSLFLVFVLTSFLAVERFAESNSERDATAAIVAALAALYTHNYGLFLVPGLALWASVRGIRRERVLRAVAVIGIGYLPWAPMLWRQMASGAAGWIERLWLELPPATALGRTLAGFCIGGSVPAYVPLGSDRLPEFAHLGAYLVFAFLVGRALRSPGGERARSLALTVALLLGVPFLLSFWRPIYLVGRHDLFALPLFLLLAARGATLGNSVERVVVSLIVGALATASLTGYFLRSPVAGARRQATLLVSYSLPAEPILATGFTRNPLEYYLRLAGGRQPFYSFPTSFGLHRGWVDERELSSPSRLKQDADSLVASLSRELVDDRRLWIAHSRQLAPANDLLMARIAERFQQSACPGNGEGAGFTCWRSTRAKPFPVP